MDESSIKHLAKAAFSPAELEFLLRDNSFRLIFDSHSESPDAFLQLCKIAERLLSERDAPEAKNQKRKVP